MSAAYTLHVARGGLPGDPRALERADLVRDGFAWWAFLAPALWFALHRHWVLAAAALALTLGLPFGLRFAGVAPPAIIAAEILIRLLVGFEAASLRRWAYGLRHRPMVDVVLAANEAEAEAKSFARWLAPPPPAPSRPTETPFRQAFARSGPEPIIGLFPDREGVR